MSAPSQSSSSSSHLPNDKKRKKTYGARKQLAQAAKRSKLLAQDEKVGGSSEGSSEGSDSDSDEDDENESHITHPSKSPKPASNPNASSGNLKNVPMVLITCDSGKEQMCVKEMMAWMNDVADREYPRTPTITDSSASSAPAGSISGGLAAELAALKAEQRASHSSTTASAKASAALGLRFKVVADMMKMFRGLVFIAVLDETIPVVELIEKMLIECRETKIFRTRFSVHLQPFVMTSYSEMESVLKMADAIVPPSFDSILNSTDPDMKLKRKFSVEWIRRGNHTGMDRTKVIDHLAQLVPKSVQGSNADGFTVDLKQPDVVIMCQVVGRLCGIAVYSSYLSLHKFNIRTLFESVMGFKQEVEVKSSEDQAAAKAAAQEKKRKKGEEHQQRMEANRAKYEAKLKLEQEKEKEEEEVKRKAANQETSIQTD